MKNNEEKLQLAVCNYIRLQYPQAMFNSDLSGVKLSKSQAGKAKMLRSNKGFPDLVIYEKRGRYSALFIELKAENARVYKKDGRTAANEHVETQLYTIRGLTARGFCATICIGFEQARRVIDAYMLGWEGRI